MVAKFDFWEKVVFTNPIYKSLKNTQGYIIGKAEENNKYYYSVMTNKLSVAAEEHELTSLGEFIDPDTHWSGDSMTVTVDEKGRGSVKEYKSKNE